MEARAQHPGTGELSDAPQRAIGMDLGTTNSALAWADPRGPLQIFDVPQLVAPSEMGRRPVLPSFLYLTDATQRDSGIVRLPWNEAPDVVAGVFAREEGALVPARQISSTKSWLSNAHVDRTAPLLPWNTESGTRLSPVDASARLLMHLRDAWNHVHASNGSAAPLEDHAIVLTVPASFDEEARELTVQAARQAGFARLTLLEEPLAALYAWIAAHRRQLASTFAEGQVILVCDVGGGTTDFSLIRVRLDEGDLAFERVAIGEHLLLGGDNLDLALAVLAEQKLGDATRLSLTQRLSLRRKCSAAKEQLLSDPALDRVAITILGAGRGVVAGGMTVEITRDEVLDALTNGFLPVTAPTDLPARDRRVGLRELGLPFETEPAITKHLAAFLTRAAQESGGSMVQPDAILFNGGFFAAPVARTRIIDALESWFGARPLILENERPESAVALGAAFYGRLRRDPSAPRRLLIRAGSARAYYVGVGTDAGVCVMPRGTQEGTRFEIDREFIVQTNRPAAFTLYSSMERNDPVSALIALRDAPDMVRHAPLITALRYGKRSRSVPLPIGLDIEFTETGTLELWCQSRTTGHRWRLAFDLRGTATEESDEAGDERAQAASAEVVIGEDALTRAAELIRSVFAPDAPAISPASLVGELENALGHGKHAWPLTAIRGLADVLLAHEHGRHKGAAFEVRWLNLTGFCTRPGFGSALDSWRVSELRKVYAAGLAFPKEIQNQVEWLVLWQRVGAGFSAGQQRELAQRVMGQLGLGGRKAGRVNPQIDREGWRLLASLERLDAGLRTRLGDELLDRIRREPRNTSWLWSIGRLGARAPLYGPLNSVVSPNVAERWIDRLLTLKEMMPDAALAIAQIGARTGDPARDISEAHAAAAADRLGAFPEIARRLREVVPADRADSGRIFGESLPEGLQLADALQETLDPARKSR